MKNRRVDKNPDWWRGFQLHYPPATLGNWRIQNFDIKERDRARLRSAIEDGRDPGVGKGFTKLEASQGVYDGEPRWRVWMSDTKAEIEEHLMFFQAVKSVRIFSPKPRVLINGLGLGMAVHGALKLGAGHIDVVEIDPDIVKLVGPLVSDDRVTIHQDDAFTKKWKPGTQWDVAWHDIWPEISSQNVPEMTKLHRKYGSRVAWQESWTREDCKNHASREAAMINKALQPLIQKLLSEKPQIDGKI